MTKMERLNGTMGGPQVSSAKLNRQPFQIYSRQEEPNEGLEILYVEGDNHALINPNGFPWFNLRLDPKGSRMRKDQHHTILESGYDHVVSILKYLFEKYDEKINNLTDLQDTVWNDRPSWVVGFNNPNFRYMSYKAKENETVLSIADKFKLSSYMILKLNEIVDRNEVLTGRTITIPSDYSSKMKLIIDKELMVPLVMQVYDDKGLFEVYQYSELKVNPTFHPSEFSESYPDYGF